MRQPREWIAIAALLATTIAAATSHAQQAPVNSNRLMFDPTGMQGEQVRPLTPAPAASTVGQPAAKPATPKPSVAAPAARPAPKPTTPAASPPRQAAAPKPQPQPATRPATAPRQTAAPKPQRRGPAAETPDPAANSRTAATPVARETPKLGRVPLETGTFGFENQTQLRDYNMSDGRKVPGFDNIQRNDSSYFGLSLRMPTFSSPSSSSSPASEAPSLFRDHGAN